jgi:hypothetical protein
MRAGNFTSSKNGKLMASGKAKDSFGKPALTYIEEINMERRLGRGLTGDTDSKPTDWGHCLEPHVFGLLGLEYSTISKQTIVHPDYDFWAGTPDSICYGHENTVCDVKCPYTLKSFCQLIDGWESNGIQGIRDNHEKGEDYYWQLVSNACLTGCNYGELIVYCPYKRELQDIDMGEYPWMMYTELPFLIEGEHYKNLNKFRFPIPETEKIAIHNRVVEAGKMLVPRKILTVA